MKRIIGTALGVLLLLVGAGGMTQATWHDEVEFGAIKLKYDPAVADQGARETLEPSTPNVSQTSPPTPSPTEASRRSPDARTDESRARVTPEPTHAGEDVRELETNHQGTEESSSNPPEPAPSGDKIDKPVDVEPVTAAAEEDEQPDAQESVLPKGE